MNITILAWIIFIVMISINIIISYKLFSLYKKKILKSDLKIPLTQALLSASMGMFLTYLELSLIILILKIFR